MPLTSISIVPVGPAAGGRAGRGVEVGSGRAGVHVLVHADCFGPFAARQREPAVNRGLLLHASVLLA